MSIVYLNGQYMAMEDAKISPLDRGFLFGDGIYEVIPSYAGKMVGFTPHIKRMQDGLAEVGINLDYSTQKWQHICQSLAEKNGNQSLGIYLHVTRGADTRRLHAYPKDVEPTVFAMAFDIPTPPKPDRFTKQGFALISTEDLRWQRCHIKSTALLGNVMHYQQGHEAGCNETLLYNQKAELTEASSSNVFVIKDGVIITPPLDNQLLPGITRKLILDIIKAHSSFELQERIVTIQEARQADEIWISSSSKEIAPVISLDGKPVGDGKVGEIWQQVASLYSEHKFDY